MILIYATVKAIRPSLRALPLAASVFVFAVSLECAQGIGLADRLGFVRGSIPSIVIGTHFDPTDLLMYALGCLTAWRVDVPGRRKSA